MGLAMSRSFGDTIVHGLGVSCEPEVTEHAVDGSDRFLIVATDGIWDVIDTNQAVQIVQAHIARVAGDGAAPGSWDPAEAANVLGDGRAEGGARRRRRAPVARALRPSLSPLARRARATSARSPSFPNPLPTSPAPPPNVRRASSHTLRVAPRSTGGRTSPRWWMTSPR